MKAARNILFVLLACLLVLSAQAQNLDSVLARLRSDAVAERVTALRQLAKMSADLRTVEPLMNTLTDTSPTVRREALKTWGVVGAAYDNAIYKAHRRRGRFTQEQNHANWKIWRDWQKRLIASLESCIEDRAESIKRQAVLTLTRYVDPIELPAFPPEEELSSRDEFITPSLVAQAGDCLGRIAERRPALLLTLAQESDVQVVHAVTDALASEKSAEVRPILKRFLRHPDPLWRLVGYRGMSSFEEGDASQLPLLSDPDYRIRAEVTTHINNDREDKDKILKRLVASYDQSSVPLKWSILQLIDEADTHEYDSLLEKACQEREPEVLAQALRVAAMKNVSLSEAYVRDLLHHADPRVRRHAADIMPNGDPYRANTFLIPLLQDRDESVRDWLIKLLRHDKDPRLLPAFVSAFRLSKKEEDPRVTSYLVEAGESSYPLILQLLSDRDWRMRRMAVEALGRISHPEVMLRLSEAARDVHPKVRSEAASALEPKRDENSAEAVRILMTLLEDSDKSVCLRAIHSLYGTGNKQAHAILTRLSQSNDADIADEALDALARRIYVVTP
jgi:HEAT repeat protein